MNEFSVVCRIIGTLFNRSPQDPLLAPLFTLIEQGKLAQQWPLEQDALMARWQRSIDLPAMSADYEALFGAEPSVSPWRSSWAPDAPQAEIRAFFTTARYATRRRAGRSLWRIVAGCILAGRSGAGG
ncbi:hypothetical protein DZS_19470 [Dickeya ananatis]